MKSILKAQNLTKDYGNQRGALDITFEIYNSEIVGFIGPNGAGKTTTMKMLTKLITPDKGRLFLFNKEIKSESDYLAISDKIVFLPSEGALYDNLTPLQIFNYAAKLYSCNTAIALSLSKRFKIDLNVKIRFLSLGNRRKVAIVQALMNNPKLAILDEPTSGLDPLMQRQVLELIMESKKAGSSILLSSHNLVEVENICDRIIMIKSSKIIFSGTTKEVLNKSLKLFRIENVSKNFYQEVKKLTSIKKIEYVAEDIIAYIENPKELLQFLSKKNHYNFYIEKPTLEEAFLEYY